MSDATSRAAHARQLMDDPMLIEALANIRQAAIMTWERTAVADKEGRDMAWMTVKVVRLIEAELESVINNGAIAAARIQRPLGSN